MKQIVICGAGEVGRYAAEVLAQNGHSITIIDFQTEKLRIVEDIVDVRSIKGFSCHPKTLKEAQVANSDLLIAATNQDEVNLLTAGLGKRMGARRVVARIHHRAYLETKPLDYRKEFDIDHIICPEQLTSLNLVGNLEDPGVMAIERFAQNKIEMHRYAVGQESAAIGTKLSDLSLPTGMRLAVVHRKGHSFAPVGETVLQADDIVTLIGEPEHFQKVQKMFHRKKRTNNNVAIMGGTSMAIWLANDLCKRKFNVRVFEQNKAKAIELSERLSKLTVLHTDPTDPTEFREEHLEECSAFIAATDSDEQNIMAALQAKQLGAESTASIINMPTYLSLLENLGVDWPISPRIVAAKKLLKLIDDAPVRKIATLAPKVAEVYGLGPTRSGLGLNSELRNIELPKGTFIAAIQRGEEVHVPGAKDTVREGDELVIIGPSGLEKLLRKLFVGK